MEKVIALCGAGGKTTLLWKLKDYYRELGKIVLVTTTTKMYREDCTLLGPATEICAALEQTGFAMAGRLAEETTGPAKITSLCGEDYLKACSLADIVLVEADGARHRSVKMPNDTDIVLPGNVTDIYILMGTWDIGRPVGEVVHRSELLETFHILQEAPLTQALIDRIIDEKYLPYCSTHAPAASCRVFYSSKINHTLQFAERTEYYD